MKSDRELDAWIAENIFNWKLIPQGTQMESTWITAEHWLLPDGTTSSACNGSKNYTSDMNEAIKVLRYFHGTLSYDSVEWNVGTIFDLEKFVAYHANPAMAICLAAYKLKTGKDWKCEPTITQ